MKSALLSLLLIAFGNYGLFGQTTATDFSGNDCSGVSHHLFSELDAGQIIVVSFVMPCIGCVVPTQETQSVVEGFGASHPGKVAMYISDDDGGTSCAVLNTWRNSNGVHLMPTFSDSSFLICFI